MTSLRKLVKQVRGSSHGWKVRGRCCRRKFAEVRMDGSSPKVQLEEVRTDGKFAEGVVDRSLLKFASKESSHGREVCERDICTEI